MKWFWWLRSARPGSPLWMRLWYPGGPGLVIYDARGWVPFSVRYGYRKSIRLGRWVLTTARRPMP